VGNRYVWQGGQTENQGGQTKNFFRRFAPNFAHPGLKPCRRPCTDPTNDLMALYKFDYYYTKQIFTVAV